MMEALTSESAGTFEPPREYAGTPASAGRGLVAAGTYLVTFGFAFAARLAGKLLDIEATPVEADGDAATGEKSAASTPRRGMLAAFLALCAAAIRPLLNRPLLNRSKGGSVQGWTERVKRRYGELSSRRDGIWEYILVTAAYWGFTITDGAIRMLILFQFHLLGYSAFQIAMLFLFYEIFGVVTNLVGGWIGANFGLRVTLTAGGWIQIFALAMLALVSHSWPVWFVVTWVMISQALSGIAKDLTKMSSKSAIKSVIPAGSDERLYHWVSVLTGSKNALKGVGFFVGAALLTVLGFPASLLLMAAGLVVLQLSLMRHLPTDLGKPKKKEKFSSMFALDRRVNILSAARFFLFGARDVWFVVALPIFMASVFGWSPMVVAAYLALWTIGYGIVQSTAPKFISAKDGGPPKAHTVVFWATTLAAIPLAISLALLSGIMPAVSLIGGLAIFGVVFAINSAVHSYMIVYYSESEKAAMTVGFYYMANAGGRLIGTVLSGVAYQFTGIVGCLVISTIFVTAAALISTALALPERKQEQKQLTAGRAPVALLPAQAT